MLLFDILTLKLGFQFTLSSRLRPPLTQYCHQHLYVVLSVLPASTVFISFAMVFVFVLRFCKLLLLLNKPFSFTSLVFLKLPMCLDLFHFSEF